LFAGHNALFLKSLLDVLDEGTDGFVSSRLKEIEMNLEGVFVLPEEIHKLHNQQLDVESLPEV
jgi:hypothetical protein